jgi:alanine racemase
MGRPTQAVILLKALSYNWNLLKRHAPAQAPIIPVLKANAYGHGAVIVALHLQKLGVAAVAVALLEEAQELREAGFKKQIFLLGPFERNQVIDILKYKVTPIIGNMECLKILAATKKLLMPKKLSQKSVNSAVKNSKGKIVKTTQSYFPIHLKWDTNMNRLGFREEELPEVLALLAKNPNLQVKGICTHLLQGEDLGKTKGFSEQQLKSFQRITEQMQNISKDMIFHVFNSDAFFQQRKKPICPSNYGARIGLALFGYTSVKTELSKKLKPVMKLCSKIVQLKKIRRGESVSYNATWVAKRDSVIAVVPMGYADGYRRALSNKGQVLVRGTLVSVVGTVCMDYFMIDVTDVHTDHPLTLGEDVELWGPHVDLKELAKKIDTIPYELLTTLGPRVARVTSDNIE